MAKTPLQVIVSYKQLDIIMHPVILKMLQLKWLDFGRVGAVKLLLMNLLYILLWTSLAVGVPWQTRYLYILPSKDIWRIIVWILSLAMTSYYIWIEINEILISRRRFRRWKNWKIKNIQEDMKFCHPKWPEEMDYLNREIDNLDEMLPAYFQDFWNFFDWTVYFLNFAVLITHATNIVAYNEDNRPPPCCVSRDCASTATLIRSGNLTEKDSCALPNAFVNNASLSVWVNRVFVINIIMMWLRLMKSIRSFRTLGPFVVMLGKIFYDIVRFLFLYFEFYIPYACAFWMVFGGEPSIESMSTVDQMLFSLYRITLVDDYQYDEMHAFDVVMTYFLVGTFLGVSAILCINLFIALLSDTFQRVYDNASANAVMQQAIQIISIEENLNPRQKQNFRRFINRKCTPWEEFYDDDLTSSQEDNLKKATLQIRDQMNEVLEHLKAEQREKRGLDDDQFDRLSSKPSQEIYRSKVTHADVEKLSSDMSTLVRTISKYQTENARMLKKFHKDMRDVKSLLTRLSPDIESSILQQQIHLPQRVFSGTHASMFEPVTFGLGPSEFELTHFPRTASRSTPNSRDGRPDGSHLSPETERSTNA